MEATLFPEILRASQKDETILAQVSGDFSRDFWLKILGPKKWLQYNKWIEALTHFLYFSCTTLSDLQTPGEEYTGLVQIVPDTKPRLPSKTRRFLMILGQTFGPLWINHFISKYWNHESKLHIEEIIDTISKINILWFYCEGLYYHLSKRFLNISYLPLRPKNQLSDHLKWLPYLSILNIALLLYQFWKKSRQTKISKQNTNVIESTSDKKCALCLEPRMNPTSTLCGHIFCWSCILESLQIREDCPLCREKIQPNQLIPLRNYT